MSLTRAEKNAIIINESKGIQHPDYYVCHTKTGGVQVRKRKKKLEVVKTEVIENTTDTITETSNPGILQDSWANGSMSLEDAKHPKPVKEKNYDTVSNKQLLDMMIQILDKTTESKDKNLNDVEREKETKENEEFTEGIKMRAEKVIKEKLPEREIRTEIKTQETPQPTQPRVFRRKGRNLLR